MLLQVVVVAVLVAFVQTGGIGIGLGGGLGLGGLGLGGSFIGGGIAAPIGISKQVVVDVVTPPRYEFKYGVQDQKTGDNKQQAEVRVGDVVQGEYSLAEPDGTIRVVKYTADDKNGFNAVVSRIGHAVHPQILVSKGLAVGGIGLGGLGGNIGGIGLGGLGGNIGGIGLGGNIGGIGLGGNIGGVDLGGNIGGVSVVG